MKPMKTYKIYKILFVVYPPKILVKNPFFGSGNRLAIHKQIIKRGYLQNPHVEAEMLFGIRPELCKQLKDDGLPVRVYLTYGVEWYLYLCHRIAEYPPNIYVAITDMIRGEKESSLLY